MNTQPHSFERQIRWLKRRKAQFCTLSELVGRMNRQEEGRFVAITLDDGYVDNFTQAYRIIKTELPEFRRTVSCCAPYPPRIAPDFFGLEM